MLQKQDLRCPHTLSRVVGIKGTEQDQDVWLSTSLEHIKTELLIMMKKKTTHNSGLFCTMSIVFL